jgi:hypothetical protein
MGNFFLILAWLIAIPCTLYVLFVLVLLAVVMVRSDYQLTIGSRSLIPYILFAISWAWILSR